MRLREATLRKPLGLTLSAEELSDDAHRRHFCAVVNGSVIGSVSFKRLGAHTLQLKQMAVEHKIERDSLMWKEGMAAWAAASSLPDIASIFSGVPPKLPG